MAELSTTRWGKTTADMQREIGTVQDTGHQYAKQ